MIYHIISQSEWNRAKQQEIYEPESLKKDSFIHCSTEQQVSRVANSLYQGHDHLLVLAIDEQEVEHEVIYEDLYELNEEFPHIYGPLNVNAVKAVYILGLTQYGNFLFDPNTAKKYEDD